MPKVGSDEELQRLHQAGVGLIYNDYSPNGRAGNMLHAAWCDEVKKMDVTYDKYFWQDRLDAGVWLGVNRGPEHDRWRRCERCKAASR